MIEDKKQLAILEKWCLPESARALGYTINKQTKNIEIRFELNGSTLIYETAFPGWTEIRFRIIDNERKHA